MHIKGLATGPIQENCYLVYNDDTLLIIDPGEDAPQIIQLISEIHEVDSLDMRFS